MSNGNRRLEEKVALVTGSGRGIGRALAKRYASLGAKVIVNYAGDDRSALDVVDTIEQSGGVAIAVKAEVSKLSEIDRLFGAALEKFGRLDIVVANAGVELVNVPVVNVTEEDFDRLFAVNTKGGFFTLQRAARHVVDNGRIIYIGSSKLGMSVRQEQTG